VRLDERRRHEPALEVDQLLGTVVWPGGAQEVDAPVDDADVHDVVATQHTRIAQEQIHQFS
jgi:hypothetical protein